MDKISVEDMSRRNRKLTPLPFARLLAELVLAARPAERVAVLWTCRGSHYHALWPRTDCWPVGRDANAYAGPWPVICHPPCGPWGKLSWRSKESKRHGIKAMALVHLWGGIVEQPLGSQLFRLHGDGRPVVQINQGDYGHCGNKPTLLYIV